MTQDVHALGVDSGGWRKCTGVWLDHTYMRPLLIPLVREGEGARREVGEVREVREVADCTAQGHQVQRRLLQRLPESSD